MGLSETEFTKARVEAERACEFDLKGRTGGLALKHKPSSYGVALKYLISSRGYTYGRFAKMYNGTTAQNLNNIINRIGKDRFFNEDIGKMCKLLRITPEYLEAMSGEIERIEGGGNGVN